MGVVNVIIIKQSLDSFLLLVTLLLLTHANALAMAATTTTKEILVCGATGNTGGATIDALLASPQYAANEIHVRALVRSAQSDKAHALQEKGVTLLEGSYDDTDSLKAALDNANACFLCCNNALDQVAWETNVIEAAEQSAACNYLVKVSTVQAKLNDDTTPPYIAPDSVIQYGRYHAAIEERLRSCDSATLMHTILRPNYFMQNGVGDIFGTLPQKMIAYPHKNDYKAALIDLRDIGAVAAQLLLLDEAQLRQTYHGKALNVCGPKAWSIQDLAHLYSKALHDVPIQFVRCDAAAYSKGLEGAGFPEWLAASVTKTHSVFWDGNALDFESSPEVKALLPKFRTLEEWVAEMAPLVSFPQETK